MADQNLENPAAKLSNAYYTRRRSSVAQVGQIAIGGNNPVRVQSMTTTDTNDTEACVAQIKRIVDAGGELVRLTTQGTREAENMACISARIKQEGIMTPLVADVHFNPAVADVAARYCEKVRINPGNYVDPARTFKKLTYNDEEYAAEVLKIEERLHPFLAICKNHHTAVRIGVNHGSLSDRIMSRFGDTPEGIVESCMEFLRVCCKEDFQDVVLSIKASNTVVMVRSVRMLVEAMNKEDMHFPLHLGVTEAGEGEDGRVRSAVGIGALLTEGLGDTIRVSLSEEPECEIPVARKLVNFIDECAFLRYTSPIENGVMTLTLNEEDAEDLMLKAAMAAGAPLIDGQATDLVVINKGKEQPHLTDSILQAARVRFTHTEFISCPGCGRTLYDLQGTIARIKTAVHEASQSMPRLNSLKIAIMGCIVNGPGEMADADYGYVGAARHKVSLYRGKVCVEKNIPEEEAVERLLQLIREDTES